MKYVLLSLIVTGILACGGCSWHRREAKALVQSCSGCGFPGVPRDLKDDGINHSDQPLTSGNDMTVIDHMQIPTASTFLLLPSDPEGTHPEIVGTLDDGICSVCKKLGKKSTVTMDMYSTVTAMYCGGGEDRYDEHGKLLPKPPAGGCNTATQGGRCSNGHKVIKTWKQ